MLRARIPGWAVAGAGTVWLLAACGGSPLDAGTGLEAEVRRGPIQPVEIEGVDNTAPVAGARVLLRRGAEVVARADTDDRGLATLTAAPGEYTLHVSFCPGALGLPEPQPVQVAAGDVTRTRLECDTGIR